MFFRRSGIIVLVLGAALAGFHFTNPFARPIEHWVPNEDGVLIQKEVDCPSPGRTLFGDASQNVELPSARSLCVRAARTRMVEAVIILGVAVPLGVLGIFRGPKPTKKSIEEELRPLPPA